MTVLIVDDQINITSGLISGLNWDVLDVTSIHTASSAVNARRILEKEQIDILLCDIEMPGENGLSLLRWARKKGLDFICIFLTAHADFLYAKEAIQLGCFDYILQPARYDEIQATIEKAIVRAKSTRTVQELKRYGTYAKNNPTSLFQNLFMDWLAGKPLAIPRFRSILKQLNLEIQPHCDCAVILCHLLCWNSEPWTTDEWVYGLNNMISEIYTQAACENIFFTVDRTTIGWFLYAPYGSFQNKNLPFQCLQNIHSSIKSYYPCDFAFYITPTVALESVSDQSKFLLQAKRNNVMQKSGLFLVNDLALLSPKAEPVDSVQVARWGDLLFDGNTNLLIEEIFNYFSVLTSSQKIDYQFLHTFWYQFQQVVLNVLWTKRIDGKSVLPLLSLGENAKSVQQLKEAIIAVASVFEQKNIPRDEKDELIIKIEKYVDDHMDEPLNVSNIAKALYMNADYLSRVFKNKRGIPLKDYILTEKMHTAQVLLRTTSLPISIIASKLGYENYSYFSQVYRKITGISPTNERKK